MNLERLPQLAQDKANHHIYGQLAALAGALLAPHIGGDARVGAVLVSVAAGALKEAWDHVNDGDVSLGDIVATASGSVPIVVGYCLAAGWV